MILPLVCILEIFLNLFLKKKNTGPAYSVMKSKLYYKWIPTEGDKEDSGKEIIYKIG